MAGVPCLIQAPMTLERVRHLLEILYLGLYGICQLNEILQANSPGEREKSGVEVIEFLLSEVAMKFRLPANELELASLLGLHLGEQ